MAFLKGIERPQHIPSQTDTVVRFVQEHVAVFLCLCNLGSKGRHKATTQNGVPQGRITFVRDTSSFQKKGSLI